MAREVNVWLKAEMGHYGLVGLSGICPEREKILLIIIRLMVQPRIISWLHLFCDKVKKKKIIFFFNKRSLLSQLLYDMTYSSGNNLRLFLN